MPEQVAEMLGWDGMTLAQVADALVGVESSQMLLHRVEQLLARVGAHPARLWLIETTSMVFYPVAAIGCESEAEDLPAEDILLDPPPGCHLLYHQGDPIGLLSITTADYDRSAVGLIAALLGPTLMGVNNHEQTLRELRHMHLQSERLIAAGRLLQHLDIEVLLTEIMQCILETVQADVGAILILNSAGDLEETVSWGLNSSHIDALRTRSGERLVDAVLESGQNLRLHAGRLRQELRFDHEGVTLTGILALPLISSDRRHGVVLLANPQNRFTKDDERLVTVVCDMATIALDNLLLVQAQVEGERIRRDMEVARQVQARMQPDAMPNVPRLSISGMSVASEETGGDYYTWMERDGRLVAMIGDVTGHGLGAALFTTAAHAMVQYQFRNSRNLAHALEALNQGLYHMRSGRFMTCAAVEVDPQAMTFTYASAGHNPLALIHGGELQWLHSSGTPLGILPSSQVKESAALPLSAGDILLLYTDGITEAFNDDGDWWGEDAMAESLKSAHRQGLPAAATIERLMTDMRTYAGGKALGDDVTLLAISVSEEGAGPP
ncbi:MAG: GAF domain-containing protein [Planctomycetota bacterium]|nr:MAG: GAF domain-containing protein [Planctomycetota bacterium]